MAGKRDHNRRLFAFARQMRRAPTDAEKMLWNLLRRGQLDGYHFRRQVPIAGYIVDFCCLAAGLAIEADGGQHYDEEGKRYDEQRRQVLLGHNIRIIRFSDYDILRNAQAVQETIYHELNSGPHPCPPPEYRGRG